MARDVVLFGDRIVQGPRVMFGKPVVKGTRIPMEIVLEELAHNPDLTDLFDAHPALTVEDVQACLAYSQHLMNWKRPRRNVPDHGELLGLCLFDTPRMPSCRHPYT